VLGRRGGRGGDNYGLRHFLTIWACLGGIMENVKMYSKTAAAVITFPVDVAV
jgi:hypothetical protein